MRKKSSENCVYIIYYIYRYSSATWLLLSFQIHLGSNLASAWSTQSQAPGTDGWSFIADKVGSKTQIPRSDQDSHRRFVCKCSRINKALEKIIINPLLGHYPPQENWLVQQVLWAADKRKLKKKSIEKWASPCHLASSSSSMKVASESCVKGAKVVGTCRVGVLIAHFALSNEYNHCQAIQHLPLSMAWRENCIYSIQYTLQLYIHLAKNIYVRTYTWKPNDPYFDWRKLFFWRQDNGQIGLIGLQTFSKGPLPRFPVPSGPRWQHASTGQLLHLVRWLHGFLSGLPWGAATVGGWLRRNRKTWVGPDGVFCVFVWGGEVEETHMSEETADESQKTSRWHCHIGVLICYSAEMYETYGKKQRHREVTILAAFWAKMPHSVPSLEQS